MFPTALLIALTAFAQITDDDKLIVTSHAFGKTFKSAITEKALEKSPGWVQEKTDTPPVSPRRAISLANNMREAVVKTPDGWEWHATSLLLFLMGGRDQDCGWHVTFQAIHPDRLEAGLEPFRQEITLIVMMDGTVVKPVVSDEKPDEKSQD